MLRMSAGCGAMIMSCKARILRFMLLFFLGCFLAGCGDNSASQPSVGRLSERHLRAPAKSEDASQKFEKKYCPSPNTLTKKGLMWYAPGGWRSYSASFINEIHGFSGAQWVGVKLGKIICIYGGVGQTAFPVSIERDNLVNSPRQNLFWGPDQGGYRNCQGERIQDCPYEMKRVTNKKQDVYEGIKDFVR